MSSLPENNKKTKEEAEWISATQSPVSSQSVKDKIKKVVVGTTLTPQTDLCVPIPEFPTKSFCNHGGGKSEEKFKISFSVGAEFMEKLTRTQELMFSGDVKVETPELITPIDNKERTTIKEKACSRHIPAAASRCLAG